MIDYLQKFYEHYKNEINEGVLFSAFVMFGVIVKTIRAIQKGSRLSLAWFFSEALVSFFIALIVYAVVDQFFMLKPFFTCAVCALLGSFSTLLNKKLEELIETIFDQIKSSLKEFFKALIDKFKSIKL
jgi:energy-converting hydrogenase Eha subunit A